MNGGQRSGLNNKSSSVKNGTSKSSKAMQRKNYSDEPKTPNPEESERVLMTPLTRSKINNPQTDSSSIEETNEVDEEQETSDDDETTVSPALPKTSTATSQTATISKKNPSSSSTNKNSPPIIPACYRRQKCCTVPNNSPWTPYDEDTEGTPYPLTRTRITQSPPPPTYNHVICRPTNLQNYRQPPMAPIKEDMESPSITDETPFSKTDGKNKRGKELENRLKEQESSGWFDVRQDDHQGPDGSRNNQSPNPYLHSNSNEDEEGNLGSPPPKQKSTDSAFSLGLPPIKRKIFPNYPLSVIIPQCKPINKRRRKKKKPKKVVVDSEPWTDALRSFYETSQGFKGRPNPDSDLEGMEDEVEEGEEENPTSETQISKRKTLEEVDILMKRRLTDIQTLFDAEMRELKETYERLKLEPDPTVEESLERAWEVTKHSLQGQIDEAMVNLIKDIKSVHHPSSS